MRKKLIYLFSYTEEEANALKLTPFSSRLLNQLSNLALSWSKTKRIEVCGTFGSITTHIITYSRRKRPVALQKSINQIGPDYIMGQGSHWVQPIYNCSGRLVKAGLLPNLLEMLVRDRNFYRPHICVWGADELDGELSALACSTITGNLTLAGVDADKLNALRGKLLYESGISPKICTKPHGTIDADIIVLQKPFSYCPNKLLINLSGPRITMNEGCGERNYILNGPAVKVDARKEFIGWSYGMAEAVLKVVALEGGIGNIGTHSFMLLKMIRELVQQAGFCLLPERMPRNNTGFCP